MILFVLINYGYCAMSSTSSYFSTDLKTELKKEINSEIRELWNAVYRLNSSDRCYCPKAIRNVRDRDYNTEEYNEFDGEKTDKPNVILNLDNIEEIFREYVDEKLESVEQKVLDKTESLQQTWNEELHRFSNKVRESFVDFEDLRKKESHELRKLLTEQQTTITENEERINYLEIQLKNISSVLLQPFETRSTPLTTTPVTVRQCPEGWSSFNDICYTFSRQRKGWFFAKEACYSVDGKLAEPKTSDQVNFLFSLTQGTRVWIGVTDRFTEGSYVWDSSREPVSYLPWEPGQPNNFLIDQDCVEIIDTDPLFNDKPCFAEDAFVCEK